MSDIMITGGDINTSVFGDIITVNDDDDIIQSAIHNILTVYGENIFHPTLGNKAHNSRTKLSETNMADVADQCKNAIMGDIRVDAVSYITATKSTKVYGQCDIVFALITKDGKQLSSNMSVLLI